MKISIQFEDGSFKEPTKIVAVGRNYHEHIKEMHSEKTESPVLFIKPTTALCDINQTLKIPENMGLVHHEIELAICISDLCRNVSAEQVPGFIAGYGLALDLTLRDVQAEAKKKGLPWAVAKGFDGSCPVSVFKKKGLQQVQNLDLSLKLNGIQKQSGNTSQMIFSIPELISYISGIYTLLPGDIILTGTPSGVGPLNAGDSIEAEIKNLVSVKTIVEHHGSA
ncbi:MAG: fumarylacetoacetate hydrolase family protein [Calditrichaeota bacterium]|nr:fumarylacetoacetate hydrolase family protein [Calditrichota bacterium]